MPFADRIERLRRVIDEEGVDAGLFSVGADLPYLTGYEAMPLERLTMLVVKRDGDPVLVVPKLEAPRVTPGPFEVRPWDETEDPVAIVAGLARDVRSAAVGDRTWSRFLIELQGALPGVRFVRGSPLVSVLRIRKDPSEIDALGRAAAAVDRVLARLPGEVSFVGRSERDIARDVIDLTLEEGHDTAEFWIVAAGPNGASPHHEPGTRRIVPGDLIVVDFGGRLDGYCSDVTRTFVAGEPDAEQLDVHAVVAEAQRVGREAAQVGVEAQAVDRAVRAVIDHAGYGEFFIHRTGHGIGLEAHEEPYVVQGNTTVLEPGMAFSVEPGVYLPGRFGVRIEDIVVASEAAPRSLNHADRELVAVR